jgi:hypothetical protein
MGGIPFTEDTGPAVTRPAFQLGCTTLITVAARTS